MKKSEIKHYKRARAILQKSLEDIQAGHWCTGRLAQFGLIDGVRLDEGSDYSYLESQNCIVDFHDKPMGCALGLISTYGGVGYIKDFGKLGDGWLFVPAYPEDDSPEGVLRARDALIRSIPEEARDDLWEDYCAMGFDANEVVINYNDKLSRDAAEKWFKAALEFLDK